MKCACWLLLLVGVALGIAQDDPVRFIATGDVMLGSWVTQVVQQKGMMYPMMGVQRVLKNADFVFSNLEAPFTDASDPFPKQFNFKVPKELVKTLTAGNIRVVNLANNHSLDYGWPGLQETMQTLQEAGIQYIGAGRNLQEARQPAIFKIREIRIGFLGYNLTFPQEFWASDTSAGTCFPYQEFVFDDVRRLKDRVDWVVVSCHWGQELMTEPKEYQRQLAHKLIDAGADFVIGHHPHVIQGIEFYRGKLIAYSLGNFIFGSYSENARESMLLEIALHPDHSYRVRVIPIRVYNREVEFQPQILMGEEKANFLFYLMHLSGELNPQPIVISSDGMITTNVNYSQTQEKAN